LTEEDIERVVLDGERYAEEDKLLLERASNALPGSVSSVEREHEVTSPEARSKGEFFGHLKRRLPLTRKRRRSGTAGVDGERLRRRREP
jgi:hypothetical protein